MKHFLRFSLLALLMTVFNSVWAEETPYKTLQFGPDYNSAAVNNYTTTWSATYENFTCDIVNFNNNGNGWSYIRGGSRSGTWTGTITTAAAIDKAVTKVVVTVDAVKNSNGSLLEVADNVDFTNSTPVSLTPVAGDNTYTITSPKANAYYRLTFNQKKGSSNGDLQISKIVFYTESEGSSDANVTISSESIEVGEKTTISFPPSLNNNIQFESSNTDIAMVNADGEVTGIAVGEATITASWEGNTEYNEGYKTFPISVTAATPTVIYEKVTNANQLVAGNEYILVATASNMAMGAVNSTNDKIRDRVPVTITEDNKVSIKNEAVAVLTLGGEYGAWTFLASDNNNYLALKSASNEIHASEGVTDNAKWTVTNDFELKDNTYSRYLRYNSGNPRFACYTSGQQTAVLFVKEGSAVGKTPVASSCTITPTELVVGATGSFNTELEANFNGIDMTDWTSDNPEVLSVNGSYYVAHKEGTATVTFNCKPLEYVEGWENYEAVAFTQTITVSAIDPELSFNPSTMTLLSGATYSQPTINCPDEIRSYLTILSDNNDVAFWTSQEGLVVTEQVGTATITATYDGSYMNGKYKPATAILVVNVVDELPTEETATFDATIDLAATGNTAEAWSITKDGLTISADGGIGGNGSEYRIYKNNTFTVSSTIGKIKKIEFTDESSYRVSNFSGLDGWDAASKTWTGNANEVTFTASGGQVRLTLVNITYEPAVVLSDLLTGKTPYTNDKDKQVSMIIYKREFSSKTAGHRQCWFVPFDYTITDEDLERCTFYRIHMFSAEADQEGVVQDENKVVMKIVEVTSGYTLSANKPYIIKPKTAGVYEFVAENTTLKARDTGSLKYTSTSTNRYDFYGVYNSYSSDVAKQWFSLNTNGNLLWNAAGQTLGAYRWYITSTYIGDDYANIAFVIEEDSEGDETTAIEQLFNDPNAEIDGFYTVDGIKLFKPARGLNIVKYSDGRTKKVYVK